MKLDVKITKVKSLRGRIREYRANFGSLEASGQTQKEAEANLAARMQELVNEDCTPYVRVDPEDGHVWITYRDNGGQWCYAHLRYDSGGYAHMSGWTMGSMYTDRRVTARHMVDHMRSLYGDKVPADGLLGQGVDQLVCKSNG